jgi:hypothetical protein
MLSRIPCRRLYISSVANKGACCLGPLGRILSSVGTLHVKEEGRRIVIATAMVVAYGKEIEDKEGRENKPGHGDGISAKRKAPQDTHSWATHRRGLS